MAKCIYLHQDSYELNQLFIHACMYVCVCVCVCVCVYVCTCMYTILQI